MNNNPNTLKLALIGDLFPGELPFSVNYGIRSQFIAHKGKPWVNKIKGIIGDNHLTIANLESPLLPDGLKVKDTFYGSPDFAFFLKEAGINVLNIANNHILEHGPEGFYSTIRILESAGLGVVGYVQDNHSKILYRNISNQKIAIAGFSNVDLQVIKNDNHFAVLNQENVISTLDEMARANAAIKILCFHWGNEYIHVPQPEQRQMAYKFIERGADIIAGHHSHVIQPYEMYKNGHIFYSLGNFMFDYIHSKMISIGLVASLEIDIFKQFKVNLVGAKLNYKNTVTLLPQEIFEDFYNDISHLYSDWCKMSYDNYQRYYIKILKNNHFWRRVAMKTSLLPEFFKVSLKKKGLLIKNIISYYIKN